VGTLARHDRFGLLVVLASQRDDRDETPRPRAPATDLIAACRRGDRSALDAVFREHADGLERFLSRLVGPSADLEDLLQETFAAAINAFPRFRGEASVKTWLRSIAVHVAHSHLRKPRRPVTELDETRHTDSSPGPDEHEDRRRTVTRLYAHLDRIDAKKRLALVLHVVEGMSLAEIAALMDASVAATKSRLFWARRELRKRLQRDPTLQRSEP
jgi:RNA polymerase sigma-70 factor (ECF subfamily)